MKVKLCKTCKKTLAKNYRYPVCEACLNKGVDRAKKATKFALAGLGIVVTAVGLGKLKYDIKK